MEPQDIGSAVDPLSMDLSNTSTKMPAPRAGVYSFTVGKMEKKESKTKPGSFNLSVECKLAESAIDHKTGESINAGFPIYHNFSLTPTEKFTPEMIKKNLAIFMDSVLGHHNGSFTPFEQYIGQTFTARTIIESSEQYGDQAKIAAFIKKG